MRTIILDSERFEVVNPYNKQGVNIRATCNRACYWLKRFEDLYKRPSQAKETIYKYWRDWFLSMNGVILGCCGNSMMFTIYGQIQINNELYFVQITKDHNRVVEWV